MRWAIHCISLLVSSDEYRFITDEGMRTAAQTIDKAMGTLSDSYTELKDSEGKNEQSISDASNPTPKIKFEPYKGKKRKPGTGYIKQLSPNCWQGRYSPRVNGKKISRNVYTTTEAECEIKLAELIQEMKVEYGIS